MAINLPYPYPDLSTQTWDAFALLSNLQFLADRITAIQTGQLMPTDAIIMFRSGSTCPPGYNKVTDAGLANRYLRINLSSGGATGGSTLTTVTSAGGHTHTNGAPTSTVVVDDGLLGATIAVSTSTHIHVISSSGAHTHTVSITPLFLDVILCQKT